MHIIESFHVFNSVNRRMGFAQPNIKDLLRRATAGSTVLKVDVNACGSARELRRIDLLVTFLSREK